MNRLGSIFNIRCLLIVVLIIMLVCSLNTSGCGGNDSPQEAVQEQSASPTPEEVTEPESSPGPEEKQTMSPVSEEVQEPEPTPEPEKYLIDPISTDDGYVFGEILRYSTHRNIRIYRGIPYAAPPVGDLRWKPPQPVEPWEGTRKCTSFSLEPPQGMFGDKNSPQSEDCLYLNVITPAEKPGDKLPVMVNFHGGGLSWGCGNYDHVNSSALPSHDVVLVTVNSRLGVFGLLAHSLLSEESPQGVSGNYLFLDLIAALEWVRDNITAFGGDPDNVTIFGGSGGGLKVIDLMTSPQAEGLFHRAIIQSATLPHGTPLEEMEEIGGLLFERLGVDEETDPLAAARALEWEEVRDAAEEIVQENPAIYDLTVDGWFMPDTPVDIFKAGDQYPVPCIIGLVLGEADVRSEWALFPNMLPYCTDYLSGMEKAGVNGYAYVFDHLPGVWREENIPSWHGLDEKYLFEGLGWGWSDVAELFGASVADPGIDEIDWAVSEFIIDMWTTFARTGSPSVEGMITWPVYTTDKEEYLYIVYPLETRDGFSEIFSEPDS